MSAEEAISADKDRDEVAFDANKCMAQQITEFGPEVIELFGGMCLVEGCRLTVDEYGLPTNRTQCRKAPIGIE